MLRGSAKIPQLMNRAEGMCVGYIWEDCDGVRVLGWREACEFKAEKEELSGVWLGIGVMGEKIEWHIGIGKVSQLCDSQCTCPLRYTELKWVIFFSHHVGISHESKVFLVQCC